jgi:hypothetical protein
MKNGAACPAGGKGQKKISCMAFFKGKNVLMG